MPSNLRDVTRDFARHEAALETLRAAAHEERFDRRLADEILKLITEWENSPSSASAWSRNALRERAKQLVPPAPEVSTRRQDPAAAMYSAGLRGQRRLG
jgi:hypothetical protein